MSFRTVEDKESDSLCLPTPLLLSEVSELLAAGHSVTLLAKGDSMYPFITGDRDYVVLRRTGQLHVGDIVLARLSENSYVLHRIYHLSGNKLTLLGDGNICPEHCDIGDVCGTVQCVCHGVSRISCNSPLQRYKSRLWRGLLPVRRYLLFVMRKYKKYKIMRDDKCQFIAL